MLIEAPFSTRLRSWLFHPDRLAIFGLLGLLFAFYPDLFLVKAAPLTGDHLEQHYPWAFQLAQSLKEFKLPFWTPLIQCGFPLVAESQVGAFYIPNLLMYFCLPFHVAYSYMNLIHWFIAGWGTYAYAKQMKLGAEASFVAAVIFLFGGAYGGAYYNMTSLKTICWFPVALYLLERYLDNPKKWLAVGLAFLIGQSIVAGYMQMAALTWLIFGVYAVLRITLFPENASPWTKKGETLGVLIVIAACALLIALPQIYLTFQLATLSNRSGLTEGYAYVGSMSPMALGTLICPNLSNLCRGNNLYPGAFALFLVLLALCSPDTRQSKTFRLWGIMTLIALLLTLGQWSPLYVILVKLTRFYAFRFPAKFLGFFCFGLAMLSATGFQSLWQGKATQAVIKKAFFVYLSVLAFFVAAIVSIDLFFTVGRNVAIRLGSFFITRFIYAQPGHPHSLDTYLSGVTSWIDISLKYLSIGDPANLISVAASGLCVIFVVFLLQKKILARSLLIGSVVFLAADLYAASYLDIQLEFATYQKALAPTQTRQILESERSAGRLGRIYGLRSPSERLPLTPSQNMLYGIEDIGAYSPLVFQRYYQTIGVFGNLNDSNFAVTPTPAFVTQRLPILNFLNVSHVLSTEKLTHPDLKLVLVDPRNGVFLYANSGKRDEAHFITDVKIMDDWEMLKTEFLKEGFDPRKTVLFEQSEFKKMGISLPVFNEEPQATFRCVARSVNQEEWEVETDQPGFFVLSNVMFPGWRVLVDGVDAGIFKAYGVFQAVWLPKPGRHHLNFFYSPSLTDLFKGSFQQLTRKISTR